MSTELARQYLPCDPSWFIQVDRFGVWLSHRFHFPNHRVFRTADSLSVRHALLVRTKSSVDLLSSRFSRILYR
jgi:hypothetical protein